MKCPNCLINLVEHPVVKDVIHCRECGFNMAPNDKQIDSFYVWLSVDPLTDNEGIMAIARPDGIPMPMLNSNLDVIMQFEDEVKRVVKVLKMEAKLVRYNRSDVIKLA